MEELGFEWAPREDPFGGGLAELVAYRDIHGKVKVPGTYTSPSGFQLGSWCGRTRRERRAGRLSADRIAQLDALGFEWRPHESSFERGLAQLAAFVEAKGHAQVPDGYETETGYALGGWCGARRRDLKNNRLTPERKAELDALGFIWDPSQQAFEAGIAEFSEYIKTHDDPLVPSSYTAPSRYNLGKWCSHQRQDRKTQKLSAERIARLDALGFVWDPLQALFDTGIAELRAYKSEHGHTNVPQHYVTESGYKLGQWCSQRRTSRRQGRLTPDRIALLDELGFIWNRFDEGFANGIAEYACYVARTGSSYVPQNAVTESGFKLGAWCSERRRDHQAGQLTDARIDQLDAVGFDWDNKRPGDGSKPRVAS